MQSLDQLLSPTLDLLIGHINQVVIMASSNDIRKAITQQPDETFQHMEGGECTLALKICLVCSSFSLAQSTFGPQHIHMCPVTGSALCIHLVLKPSEYRGKLLLRHLSNGLQLHSLMTLLFSVSVKSGNHTLDAIG